VWDLQPGDGNDIHASCVIAVYFTLRMPGKRYLHLPERSTTPNNFDYSAELMCASSQLRSSLAYPEIFIGRSSMLGITAAARHTTTSRCHCKPPPDRSITGERRHIISAITYYPACFPAIRHAAPATPCTHARQMSPSRSWKPGTAHTTAFRSQPLPPF
jgi:hypothetical protein